MKTLLLMRHGDAPQARRDSDRMLSELGKRQCQFMGKYIKPLDKLSCVSSDYQRAIDSAQLTCSVNEAEISIKTSGLLRPTADANMAFDFIADQFDVMEAGGSLVVVCHLPIISELACLALDGVFSDRYRFPCASLMAMQGESAIQSCFDLLWQKNPDTNL